MHRQLCVGLNALVLSDGSKISLMETSLVSMWVASAMKSKVFSSTLWCCCVSVDGLALAFLRSFI